MPTTSEGGDFMKTGILTLKWKTLKAWDFTDNEKAIKALKEYNEITSSRSAMIPRDTPRQKELICEMIDAVGKIYNDWEGKRMTKKEAKEYVMDYGRREL